MQGLLQAALPHAAPAPLSSSNLASHTLDNPPAPRRTVTHYVLQQAPYVSRTAHEGYEVGPPPSDEFEGVRTPPRAREAGRKRMLEEVEGHESGQRQRRDEALVLHADDGQFARPRGSDSAEVRRKKPLLAMQLKGRSSSASAATPVAGPPRPPAKDVESSPSSSFLVPRAGPLEVDTAPIKRSRKEKGKGKENKAEPAKKTSPKKRKGKLRAEAEEADELDEVEERLRARRERRRERALIRKDRTVTSAAVGAAAASKVKAAQKKRRGDEASRSAEEESATRKSKRKRESREERARRKVQEMDKPSGVKAGRLTLKPAPQLGIFNKGKASVRTKVGKTIGDLAFSELAFLDAPRREASSPSSASSSSATSSSSRTNDENLRPTPSAARPNGPRTYGSGRRGSVRASKHFAAPVEDVQPASPAARPQKTVVAPAKKPRTRSPQHNFWIEIPSRPASSLSRQRVPVKSAPSIATDEGTSHLSVLSAASLARRRRAKKDALGASARAGLPDDPEEFPRPTLYGPVHATAREEQVVGQEGGEGDLGGMDAADHDGGAFADFQATREASETEMGTASLARMLDEVGGGSEMPDVGLAGGRRDASLQREDELEEPPNFACSLVDELDHGHFVPGDGLNNPTAGFQAVDSFGASASFVDSPATPAFADGFDTAAARAASNARWTSLADNPADDLSFPPVPSFSVDTSFHDIPTNGQSTIVVHQREMDQTGPYADDFEFREAMRRQWPKARC